jgi:hypothetical protein
MGDRVFMGVFSRVRRRPAPVKIFSDGITELHDAAVFKDSGGPPNGMASLLLITFPLAQLWR